MKPAKPFVFGFLTLTLFLQISCQKSDEPTDEPEPTDSSRYILTHSDSRLVSNLNGFRFDGAFTTSEPLAYPYLWVQYVDDYNDSTRVLLLNQNDAKSITQYQVSNLYNGTMSRSFNHGSFPNNASNNMSFSFNHDMFLINWYDPASGELSETGQVFGINTQASHIFTGLYEQYTYQFLNRYLIRYISGISLWPFNYPNWSDQSQFVATSELSAPKAIGHYYDETWSAWPYDVQSNMYSGFLQSTNEATYAGIAKGVVNLDTIFLNNKQPGLYDPQVCRAFTDKSGNTVYLGLLINVPNTPQLTASSFILDLSTNELTAVYQDIEFPYSASAFRKGCFYGRPVQGGAFVKINEQGQEEALPVPATTVGLTVMFSKNKIFAVVNESGNGSRNEVYSRPY